MIADLHMHSKYSDGLFTPRQVVERAVNKGISVVSLTDHDSIDGVEEALLVAKEKRIICIIGIEISTFYHDEPIHILGYFKEYPIAIKAFLEQQAKSRIDRAKNICKKLAEEYNISIQYEDIRKITDGIIARPHIAEAIINKGYKYTKEDILKNIIGNNSKAYIPSTTIHPKEVIDKIHKSLGYAVLAHPILIKKSPLKDFVKMGIDGIEAIYPSNRLEDTIAFKAFARENNLFVTGGSDYHGFVDNNHRDIGSAILQGDELKAFLTKIE